MKYLTVKETAKKWSILGKRVNCMFFYIILIEMKVVDTEKDR